MGVLMGASRDPEVHGLVPGVVASGMTQPDSAQETWTYNEAGELAEWQPRGGQGQADLTYDPDRGWTDASSWSYVCP